ncbi:MAG TPA: carboxymuconolactone decarboxylase family protein [Planctomycetota bacterium]
MRTEPAPAAADRMPRLAALAAAIEGGDGETLRAAAAEVLANDGATVVREVLRQMSLFSGFPRTLRALGEIAAVLPPAGNEPAEAEAPAASLVAADLERGRTFFASLYGRDAQAVLPHLESLDPLLAEWILGHAYGRVLARPGLPVPERERLAVLALAASGCWQQWESHARIALRLGVPRERLAADLRAGSWLDAAARTRAAALLAELPTDLAEGRPADPRERAR